MKNVDKKEKKEKEKKKKQTGLQSCCGTNLATAAPRLMIFVQFVNTDHLQRNEIIPRPSEANQEDCKVSCE